ncbi:hypothetical protein SBA1_330005 [Candidatus Sulfotelmatobacter kueseliae]|uniref:Uncharacterized protein n=1 Tax=Candidatus Sulfotelmatobacter kueseliae TaxID=2042962 RepID=A0A2U3KMQ6_9BACT|nr:hypothetical protein SBA1_330005 [Candidatus Sulfotelmatobacter kueseliae]
MAASASGRKFPARANSSRNVAVRRCMVSKWSGTPRWGKHRTESQKGASAWGQTSDFGPQTSDFGPQASDFGPQTSDFGPQTSDLRPQTSDLRPRAVRSGA